ncbi:MAG: diaminopimelate decarboxylase, partial [Desulfopila sp.]
MPISESFKTSLFAQLPEIASCFGTPFHIYDEAGIRQTCRQLKNAFSQLQCFKQYYAVKALPNPRILQIMQEEGFGFDCSSITELLLSRQIGATGDDIMFTSNNTSAEEFRIAEEQGGSILNLDDISLLDRVPYLPELLSFRYNPGAKRTGNGIIGKPTEAKYGVSDDQIIEAYRQAKSLGVRQF